MQMTTNLTTKALPLADMVSAKVLMTGETLYTMTNAVVGELVEGEIVPHMPTGYPHGIIEGIITALLYVFVKQRKIGHVLSGEVGIYTRRNPDTVRAADVAYISHERLANAISQSYLDVAPELIVEVMSPSDPWSGVHEKLAEYFAIGVKLVWVVDPKLEHIHVYQSPDAVVRLTKGDVLSGEAVLPGFSVTVAEIFALD